ncbi:MAG: hypothetical protein WCT49_04130 [Candidatus Paceibacterota bacterium]|jgi:hypothetical protein|nr:hypothetical protein [Candidatus Paceibacterota bacterium]
MKEKEIESLLYSYDEWKSIAKKWPYCFEIEKNEQLLYYFGANHSHDPNNEQFPVLREFWGKFMDKTGGKNSVVFVEGGLRKVLKDEEMTIKRNGEGGLITWLAKDIEAHIYCPEPTRTEETEALLKKFSKDEIEYYYYMRGLHSGSRLNPKPNFEEYANKCLTRDKTESKWEDFDFSIENMKRIHKNLFGVDFDENEDRFSYINPTTENSVINKVARACSTYRNVHIVSEILKFWQEGKNIFVVFGGAHAVLQEPALRKLL